MRRARDLFRPITAVFQFAGVWSPYYGQPVSFGSICYIMYSVFSGLLGSYLLQEIIQLFINLKNVDVDAISGFVPYAGQQSIGLIKVYILISKRHEIRPLFEQMEKPPFHRPDDEFYKKRLNYHVNMSRKFIISFWLVLHLTMNFQCALSISKTLTNKSQFNTFCSGNFNETLIDFDSEFDCSKPVRVLPWMAYFPFNTDSFPGYEIAFFYEWLCLALYGNVIFNFDMFVMVWMMGVALQFEVLCNDLLCLRENAKSYVLANDRSTNERDITKEIQRRLKDIVDQLVDLLEFFKKSNNVLTWILFVQYFWMSVLICMLLTQLSMSSVFSIQFVHAVLYGLTAAFQLFVVFFYANETMLEGLKIADAAFYSQWHLSNQYSPQIKPYIIFLVRRANMKIQLQAGRVFDVDLGGFLKVGKASYSYYTLMNSK